MFALTESRQFPPSSTGVIHHRRNTYDKQKGEGLSRIAQPTKRRDHARHRAKIHKRREPAPPISRDHRITTEPRSPGTGDMGTSEVIDEARLRKLRMCIDTEDQVYHGLKKLKIRGKELIRPPPEIFHLVELEVLDLSPERESSLSYRLAGVPPGIGKLINLKVLMLDTHELEHVPQEIGLLTSLERLSLSNNNLDALPEGFSSLRHLRSLHMANNLFENFPTQLLELSALEFLDLSGNQLSSLAEDLSGMENLETLLLSFNALEELPDSICSLLSLRCLWLGCNKLRRLPRNFGKLRNLDWGRVDSHTSSSVIDGNHHLNYPPVEICKQGVGEIARFMAQNPPDGVYND